MLSLLALVGAVAFARGFAALVHRLGSVPRRNEDMVFF